MISNPTHLLDARVYRGGSRRTRRQAEKRKDRERREGGTERKRERERAVAREEAHECTGGRELKSCGRDAVDPEKREER